MKVFNIENGINENGLVEFFLPGTTGRNNVQMGSAAMAPHTESSWSAHEGDEYSYLVKGELICYTEETSYHVKASGAIFTPAGQKHKSMNVSDEECLVIWIEVAR